MAPAEIPKTQESVGAVQPLSSSESDGAAAVASKPRGAARGGRPRGAQPPPAGSPLLLGLAAALSLAACTFGAYKLFESARSYVHQDSRFLVPVRNLEVTPPPVWIHSDLLTEVQRLADLPDVLDTLQPDLAPRIHDAFVMHSWVREVEEVRVIHPASVRVKLSYREPVAIVHGSRSMEAVDRAGVLLPINDLADPGLYLKIIGIRSTPTGPAGTTWDDPSLLAAAATADVLTPHHRSLGVTTIDMESFRGGDPKQAVVYLLTEQGTRVKWGRPPHVDYPGEVPVQDKLERLRNYVKENSSLDKPSGPYDIDVSHWKEVSVRLRTQVPGRYR